MQKEYHVIYQQDIMSFIHFSNWDQVQEQSILGSVAANLLEPLATGSAG
jgi:hypothetical protein